jgi:hypothetical protein
MKRHAIDFDVRLDTDDDLQLVAARVGLALDCTFVRGEPGRWDEQRAYVFGLGLAMGNATGIGRKRVVKLHGAVAAQGFGYAPDGSYTVEYDFIDISAYIVDLLAVRTELEWYRPTPEDLAAEHRFRKFDMDEYLGGGWAREGWTASYEE